MHSIPRQLFPQRSIKGGGQVEALPFNPHRSLATCHHLDGEHFGSERMCVCTHAHTAVAALSFSPSAFAELSIIVHYSSNYLQSHYYCDTQCKKVRWGQVVTKSIHCHFPWSLLLSCGCHLKVSGRRPPKSSPI